MKNLSGSSFRIMVIFLSITASVFFSSCGDDDDDPVNPGDGNNNQQSQITFTGGALNNQTVNLTGAAGGFSVSENISAAVLSGVVGQDTMIVTIVFPGSTTGTFEWQDASSDESASGMIISFTDDPNRWLLSDGSAGSTVITAYGQVGQAITGTFGGFVRGAADSSTVQGSFTVTRVPNGE